MLTILHIARAPVGGVFRHIADLATAQSAAGHRVGLICDSNTGGPFEAERIEALGAQLALGATRLPMRRAIGPADLGPILAIASRAHRFAPDVIHAHGAKGGVYGRLAAALERRRGRRVASFYAPHGGSLHYAPDSMAGRVYFTVERALERATDALIHVSAFEAQSYREKVGPPSCAAFVVVNGVAPEEFEPVETIADPADFLFLGAFRDLKGVDVLLAALARLRAEGVHARAAFVGYGDPADEERYRADADLAGLGDDVSFRSPLPAREAFALARAIVIPSLAESMPYVVLEAAAAGLPMIATKVGGIPEILRAPFERLVPAGDVAALAEALKDALDQPERMTAEAIARRVTIKENFSVARMASRVEAIYHSALERRYSPPMPAGDASSLRA